MATTPAQNTRTVLVAGAETGGRFAIVEAREWPGAEYPRHVHSREDEYIYVLEGRLTVERDGELIACPAGSGVLLPRGSEHSFTVDGPAARLLVILMPGGLDACLGELEQLDRPEANSQRIERLVSLAARYGVTITGPSRPP